MTNPQFIYIYIYIYFFFFLKIESYIQLEIHNVLMPVVHLVHVTTEMIKSLQYIYNKVLTSYIKMVFKIKNNP